MPELITVEEALGLRRRAGEALAFGEVTLAEHNGGWGVWAECRGQRLFVNLAVADKAYYKDSDDPNDHFLMWGKGKSGRHQQLRVDVKSGRILNHDELDLDDLIRKAEDGDDPEELERIEKEVEAEQEGEEQDDDGGESQDVVLASTDPDDYFTTLAQTTWGGTVALHIDSISGLITNYVDVAEDLAEWKPSKDVELALRQGYPRHIELKGQGSAHKGAKYGHGAAPKSAPAGAKFVGYAPHESYTQPKAHTVKKAGVKLKVEYPAKIKAPTHWAVFRHPGGVHGEFGLYHPETGKEAPAGVQSGRVVGDDRPLFTGYQQGRKSAVLTKDPGEEEKWKATQCMAMANSLPKMKRAIDDDLAAEGMPARKVCAAIVLLMNRHLFRVGSEIGSSLAKDEGGRPKRDDAGRLTGERVETFGVTKLRKDHVRAEKNTLVFEFLGKAGIPWIRIDTDGRVRSVVKQLLAEADKDEPIWQYTSARGDRRAITDQQVRDYVQRFGFDPHRFRTYYASLRFFQSWTQQQESLGPPTDAKDIKERFSKAVNWAAIGLNDEAATVQKNYILAGLLKAAESGKLESDPYKLRPLTLSEGADDDFYLPQEEAFMRWLFEHANRLEHERMGVHLGEVHLGGPWPALRAGDRWVTIKPNGPDSEEYRHVIIHSNADGTARVVWSGAPGMMNLRLNRVGSKDKIQAAEKKKNKILTPEQHQAEAERREQKEAEIQGNHEDFAKKVAEAIGFGGDHGEIMKAIGSGQIDKPKDPKSDEQKELERAQREERMKRLAEGSEDPAKAGGKGSLAQGMADDMMAGITGQMANKDLSGVSPELQEAWAKAHKDPETARKVAQLYVLHEKEDRRLKREKLPGGGAIRVINRMAFYDEPEQADKELLKRAENQVTYENTSKFWERAEQLGPGSRTYFDQGQRDALSHALAKYGTGGSLDLESVLLFGSEPIAAAIASTIRSHGDKHSKEVYGRLEQEIADKQIPTVNDAMTRADEIQQERKQVEHQFQLGSIGQAAATTAKQALTIAEYSHMARAAGSLDAAATMADLLRREKPDGIDIQAGEHQELIQARMEAIGMKEGEHFQLVTGSAHDEGQGRVMIHVPEHHLPLLLKVAHLNTKLDDKRALIKSHARNTSDFEIPGLTPDKTPKPGQQATLRMLMEEQPRLYANASVGLGKTLIFGGAAQLIKEKNKKAGKAQHGWYAVPTFLIGDTQKELSELFPGMDIAVAPPGDPEGRKKVYSEKHHVTLVGLDSIRIDGDHLAELCNSEHAPAFILGDEVHSMFTPTASSDAKKQSQRSKKLKELHAEHMLCATGTPFRKSVSETHDVLDWLHPGSLGSKAGFVAKYDRIGRGTSAYAEEQFRQLQTSLDPYTITEEDAPKGVKHNEHEHWLQPTEDQWAAYRHEEESHKQRVDSGKRRSESAALKVNRQREVIFAGDGAKNPLIQHAVQLTNDYAAQGRVGIVHCVNIAAAESYAKQFKPGEVLLLAGKVDGKSLSDDRKMACKAAINNGSPIEGGRAKVGGFEGIVTSVDRQKDEKGRITYGKCRIRGDDGQIKSFEAGDVTSLVRSIAGTSNVAGMLSTGLNLQKGTTYNIHLQIADSAATTKQRNARNYRTGQTHDVDSHYLLPDTPAQRRLWRRQQEQRAAMKGFDDPQEYGNPDYIARIRAARAGANELEDMPAETKVA